MGKEMAMAEIENVYMIGIKGSGMIAFVEIFHALGKNVFGSDVAEKFFTDATLQKLGIDYAEGFSKENIAKHEKIDLVVHSTVYNVDNNVEVTYAKEQGLRLLSYPEMIGLFSQGKKTIAVCGTHGKTTTSAMTTLALKECGADPTAIIGSRVKQLDSNVAVGNSEILVIEADEYQNKLANYSPFGVVLLNVDFDHPDFFPSIKEYKEVFVQFVKRIPAEGFLIIYADDANALEVAKKASCKVVIYGAFQKKDGQRAQIEKEFLTAGIEKLEFCVIDESLKLKVPGKHNKLNATATIAVCVQLGFDYDKAKKAVEEYEGVARRFEEIGKRNGALVIDDYAHHPTEIRATLAAAKEKFPEKKLICVFHPHTFTRTKALFAEFAKSFADADEVIVLDIYGSAREKQGGVSSKELVDEICKFQQNVKHIATIEDVFEDLRNRISNKEVVLTVGAGDVDKLARMLVNDI
jgi:UDP-N-acetylmuramate--alanine ligase